MSWTDDRVNTLEILWGQGKSASEIAEVLGGVTRNAVIGKAHRLGLSGRPSPIKKKAKATATKKAAPKKTAPTSATTTKKPTKKLANAPKKSSTPVTATEDDKSTSSSRPKLVNPARAPTFVEERPVHDNALISILELTERVCRWPLGDPTEDDFGFCGAESTPGLPYCDAHMAMAFQSSSKKEAKKIRKEATKSVNTDEDDEDEEIEDIDLENFDPDELENGDDDDLDDDEAGVL